MKTWLLSRAVVVLFATVLCCAGLFNTAQAEDINELKEKLESRRDNLHDAESRIKKFKEEVQIKKQEARSLEDQISIIEDNISHIELSIIETIAEVETTNLEIEVVGLEISQKNEEVKHQKDLLAEYIRLIYSSNQQSGVAIFLKYTSFSEAVSEATTLQDLQERSHEALQSIKILREELEGKKSDLDDFKAALENLQKRQQGQQATLQANQASKEHVLDLTQAQEQKYQELLEESKVAHQKAESEIKKIDLQIREELKKQGINKLPSVGIFDWPINTIFGISCEYHCTGYPYAYLIGPHSGMDMPTYVGTPVTAPADGYVARVHNSGGTGYNYLLLLHGDKVSTVYGHLSGFTVAEGEMVSRGSIIGYTGGAPGTNGAGLSTGPHLHFEVRVNNATVNPRNYF